MHAWMQRSKLICYKCINNYFKNIFWKCIFPIISENSLPSYFKFTYVHGSCFLFHSGSLPMSILYLVIIILIYLDIELGTFPTLWDHLLYLVMHVTSLYLKLIDCHIFLQQRCVYLGSADHCNLGSETEVNHLQVPIRQCFYREKNYGGRAIVNKESMTFHWLWPGQERGGILLLSNSAISFCLELLILLPNSIKLRFSLISLLWKWKWKPLSCVRFHETSWFTVHGILQVRILEWAAFPFSRGSSQPGIETRSPTLQAEPQGKPFYRYRLVFIDRTI